MHNAELTPESHCPSKTAEGELSADNLLNAALKRGEIPLDLVEELRLVDPKSEISKQFHAEILSGIKALCPKHDFDKHPVRILISDNLERNASYIPGSIPGLIILNKGLLVGIDRCNSEEELFAFVLHELGHYQREILGVKGNSKFEETQNEVETAVLLQRAGRDPRVVLEEARLGQKQINDFETDALAWHFDIHATPATLVQVVEATLFALELEYGELSSNRTKIDDSHKLKTLAQAAKHISFVGKFKQESNWDQLTVADRYKKLAELIIKTEHLNETRIKDLVELTARISSTEVDEATHRSVDPALVCQVLDRCIQLTQQGSGAALLILKNWLDPRLDQIAEDFLQIGRAPNSGDAFEKNWGVLGVAINLARKFSEAETKDQAISAAKELNLALKKLQPIFANDSEWLKVLSITFFKVPTDRLDWQIQKDAALEGEKEGAREVAIALYALGVRDSEVAYKHPVLALVHEQGLPGMLQELDIPTFYTGDFEALRGSSGWPKNLYNRILRLDLFKLINLARPAALEGLDHLLAGNRIKSWVLFEAANDQLDSKIIPARSYFSKDLKEIDSLAPYVDTYPEAVMMAEKLAFAGHSAKHLGIQREILTKISDVAKSDRDKAAEILERALDTGFPIYSFDNGFDHSSSDLREMPLALYILEDLNNLMPVEKRVWHLLFLAEAFYHEFLENKKNRAVNQYSAMRTLEDLHPLIKKLYPELPDFKDLSHEAAIELALGRLTPPPNSDAAAAVQRYARLLALSDFSINSIDLITAQTLSRLPVDGDYDKYLSKKHVFQPLNNRLNKLPELPSDPKVALPIWRDLSLACAWNSEEAEVRFEPIARAILKHPDAKERLEMIEGVFLDYELFPKEKGNPSKFIKDPNLRLELCRAWGATAAELIGKDNNSFDYCCTAYAYTSRISAQVQPFDSFIMLNALSEETQSQRVVSELIRGAMPALKAEHYPALATHSFVGDGILMLTRASPVISKIVLNLLSSDGSPRMLEWADQSIVRNKPYTDLPGRFGSLENIPTQLKKLYAFYHSLPLPGRAVLLRSLLVDPSLPASKALKNARNYVISDRLLVGLPDPERSTFENIFNSYLTTRSDYFQAYALAILLASKSYGRGSVQSDPIKAIVEFATKIGVLETKFIQRIGADPATRQDIRDATKSTQYEADPPSRLTWCEWIDERRPELWQAGDHIGAQLGSASGFVTIDRPEKNRVVQFLRPNALNKIESGARQLIQAIENYEARTSKTTDLAPKASSSHARALQEYDHTNWKKQFELQSALFNGVTATVEGRTYSVHVPKLYEFGEDWREVEKAPGELLTKLSDKTERQERALVVVTLLLDSILRGERFDLDMNVGGSKHFKAKDGDKQIWLLDPGQIKLTDLSSEERKLIGAFINKLVSSQGSTVSEKVSNSVKSFRADTGELPTIIEEINDALIAAHTYLAELEEQDILEALVSATKNMHKEIRDEIYPQIISLLDSLPAKVKLSLPGPK